MVATTFPARTTSTMASCSRPGWRRPRWRSLSTLRSLLPCPQSALPRSGDLDILAAQVSPAARVVEGEEADHLAVVLMADDDQEVHPPFVHYLLRLVRYRFRPKVGHLVWRRRFDHFAHHLAGRSANQDAVTDLKRTLARRQFTDARLDEWEFALRAPVVSRPPLLRGFGEYRAAQRACRIPFHRFS